MSTPRSLNEVTPSATTVRDYDAEYQRDYDAAYRIQARDNPLPVTPLQESQVRVQAHIADTNRDMPHIMPSVVLQNATEQEVRRLLIAFEVPMDVRCAIIELIDDEQRENQRASFRRGWDRAMEFSKVTDTNGHYTRGWDAAMEYTRNGPAGLE